MPILSDIEIEVTAEEVARSLNRGRVVSEPMMRKTKEALDLARDLWEPVSVFDWIDVGAVEDKSILFFSANQNREVRLHVGPHADLLAKASIALVSVHSIGPKLDEAVRQLNSGGENLLAYLLDSVGVVALGRVGDIVRCVAESEAKARGWGVGVNLSPGSLVGWPLGDQVDLVSLLPLDRVGIVINESGILVPFKSVSAVIGLGPTYTSKKVGSVCRFCMHKQTCWRRRKTDHDP
jgi:hypothetical protein